MRKKGWIALDIDGTITHDKHQIPEPVISYLRQLTLEGWSIAFATGRSFTFASTPLKAFRFPFYLLPQNGSVVLKMPEKSLLEKNYLSRADLHLARKLCENFHIDPIAYAGVEERDRCFFCTVNFSASDYQYFAELEKREGEVAYEVSSLDQCTVNEFSMLKFFGPPVKIKLVAQVLKDLFQVTQIKDPFVLDTDLLLVTKKGASKGQSLERLFNRLGKGDRVIAAGDDKNDLSMFAVADFAIAMPHAPAELLGQADLIAGPTSEFGIIGALAKAIKI